jgi:hypothetical protein
MAPRAAAVSALPAWARAAGAALRMLSRASFPILLLALLRANDPPLTAGTLARGLFALALLPELCARLVLRAFAGEWRIEAGVLHVAGAWRRIEAPCAALARAAWLRLPLPGPGLRLVRGNGGGLGLTLVAAEPTALAAALAAAGVEAQPAARDPAHAFAAARAACPRRAWDRPLAKLGLASLLPAGVAFYAHQHIAFGALLGEYYLMGLRAWLATAAGYWLTTVLYLVLWAGCFRLATETVAWLGALAAPAHAHPVRLVAERASALLYYASIPLLLALRFLA